METRLWTSPPIQEKVRIIFKLSMYFTAQTFSSQNVFFSYYARSQCALHQSILTFVKIYLV